jgi:hypothetical protein
MVVLSSKQNDFQTVWSDHYQHKHVQQYLRPLKIRIDIKTRRDTQEWKKEQLSQDKQALIPN